MDDDWLSGEITPYDLRDSSDSFPSGGSESSGRSLVSVSDISDSIVDPGTYDEAHPPRIETGRLYNVIIGRWMVLNTGPSNVQNVVYPYVARNGAITYRMQPVDEQGNDRPMPQRGWRVSEADMLGRPQKAANRLAYFEYDDAVTQSTPANPDPDPRERIRELIQRHIHDMAAEARRNQQARHTARRLNHNRAGTVAQIGAIYRRQLIRRTVRRSVRQAIRRANRRADRRIERANGLNASQDLDEIRNWVKGAAYGKGNDDTPGSVAEEKDVDPREGDSVLGLPQI